MRCQLGHEIKDDELLGRVFAVYEQQEHHGGQAQGSVVRQDGKSAFSLEQLNLPAETHTLLQEGMALTGAADLLAYLRICWPLESGRRAQCAARRVAMTVNAMPGCQPRNWRE